MQFLVIAMDGRDPAAPERRQKARPAHLEGVRKMKAEGTFLDGGAMLDEAGTMIGSMILVDFPARADVDAWIAQDPYTVGDVWEHVTVRPFRRVQL